MPNTFVPYISDEIFLPIVQNLIDVNQAKVREAQENLHSTPIDPFSATFNTAGQAITVEQWLRGRIIPKAEKSFQNQVGYFHEKIIQSITGWEPAPEVIDAVNREQQLLAEIKNRYNTTKGNHKVAI